MYEVHEKVKKDHGLPPERPPRGHDLPENGATILSPYGLRSSISPDTGKHRCVIGLCVRL